jgi:WD40 repeat protein
MISDTPWSGASTSAEMGEFLSRHGPKAWDPRDELAPPTEEDGGTVFALAISPDESLLAAGSRHGELLVWDVASGQERLRVAAHKEIIWDVAFSPDGKRLATASKDGRVKLWELAGGKPSATLTGHTGAVRAVAFSGDGLVASGGDDRTVRIWSAFSGGPVTVWVGHEQAVTDVAFTHQGAAVLSAGRDGTVKQWAVRDNDRPLVIGDPMPLFCLDLFPDGRRVAATGLTSEVAIWDLGTGRVTTVLAGQRSGNAFHVRVAEGGTSVVAGTWDGTFTKWDVASGEVLAQRKLPVSGLTMTMPQFAISPDGRFVAGQCNDRKLRIVELESGEEVTVESGPMAVGRVLFTPDGKRLMTIGFPLGEDEKPADTADVKLWEAATGKLHAEVIGGVVASIAGFSPDGRRLAWRPRARTEDEEPPDPEIVICDLDSKEIAQRLSLPPEMPDVGSLAFSPDGRHLAATAAGKPNSQPLADRMLLVWELSSGKLVHRLPDRGWQLEFTPDGSEVAVAGVDGRVRFWSVARGDKTRELARPAGPVVSAVFSLDGRKLGVAGNSPPRTGLYGAATQLRTIISLDEDGKQEQKVLQWPMESPKWSLIALADGSFVPSGSLRQRLKLDRAASDRYGLSRTPLPREAYAAGANCAYVLTSNGTILRGEISGEGKIAVAEKAIEDAACTAMAASSDGRWLALAADRMIQLRDGQTLELLHTLEGHEDYVRGLAFSRDGSRLASGSSDRTVRLWSTQNGALEATLLGHSQTVTHVSFSKRGGTVASSSRDGTIQLWDVRSGESKTALAGHAGAVHWVEFSPDGSALASAGEDGTVRLWRGASGVDGKSEP